MKPLYDAGMHIMLFGTFDDLHPGHRFLLDMAMRRASEAESGEASRVYVVVARDENVLRIKGRPPLQAQEERMAAIKKAYPDMEVMLGHASDFLAPVRTVCPDLILLGYDQRLPPGVSREDLGAKIERAPALRPETYKSSVRRNLKLKIDN